VAEVRIEKLKRSETGCSYIKEALKVNVGPSSYNKFIMKDF